MAKTIPHWDWIDEYKDDLFTCIQAGLLEAKKPEPKSKISQVKEYTAPLEGSTFTPLVHQSTSSQRVDRVTTPLSAVTAVHLTPDQQAFDTDENQSTLIDPSTEDIDIPRSPEPVTPSIKRTRNNSNPSIPYGEMISPLKRRLYGPDLERVQREAKFGLSAAGRPQRIASLTSRQNRTIELDDSPRGLTSPSARGRRRGGQEGRNRKRLLFE